jgi:hypothetical protein
MKKLLIVLSIILAGTVSAFGDYIVEEVTGRVEQEIGSGRAVVKAGDVLAEDTVLHTNIRSSVTLTAGGTTYTIGAAQNGAIASLTSGAQAGGIRIGGQVTKTNTSAADRTTGRIGTASARASSAANDLPIDEE